MTHSQMDKNQGDGLIQEILTCGVHISPPPTYRSTLLHLCHLGKMVFLLSRI